MDYETKLLLNRLVQGVEELNSPDWWVIGITVVNAIIMAWLAWRQYKLQQQQVRQQEYDIYSQLYKLVKRADAEIDFFLDEIIESLGIIPWKKAENGFLKQKLDYIERLCKELEDNSVDFEIKFDKDFFDLSRYRNILRMMAYNLKSLVKMVDEKNMIYDSSSQTIYNVDGSMEKGKAYYIAHHIKEKQYEVIIGSNLLDFIERREKLREGSKDVLETIRKRCKVE
jgi:hypothetical protein